MNETSKAWAEKKGDSTSSVNAMKGDMFELPKLFSSNDLDVILAEGKQFFSPQIC